MKCDICGKTIESSEDLKAHKEQAHPAGLAGMAADADLESPDLLGDTSEESAEIEIPKPTH